MMSDANRLKHPRRRAVIGGKDDQRDYAQAFQDGKDSAVVGRGPNAESTFSPARLSMLAEDLPTIRRDIEAKRLHPALEHAARCLGLNKVELFGLLPVANGAGLLGFLQGLLEKDRSRFMPGEPDPDPWADEDAPPPKPRRLYGRV